MPARRLRRPHLAPRAGVHGPEEARRATCRAGRTRWRRSGQRRGRRRRRHDGGRRQHGRRDVLRRHHPGRRRHRHQRLRRPGRRLRPPGGVHRHDHDDAAPGRRVYVQEDPLGAPFKSPTSAPRPAPSPTTARPASPAPSAPCRRSSTSRSTVAYGGDSREGSSYVSRPRRERETTFYQQIANHDVVLDGISSRLGAAETGRSPATTTARRSRSRAPTASRRLRHRLRGAVGRRRHRLVPELDAGRHVIDDVDDRRGRRSTTASTWRLARGRSRSGRPVGHASTRSSPARRQGGQDARSSGRS